MSEGSEDEQKDFGVFVSYRKSDSSYPAQWLCRLLEQELPGVRIFRDVKAIAPGQDFSQAIFAAVAECRVLLVLMGDRWLAGDGRRWRKRSRLEDPNDYVRLEVASALAREIPIVPVLLDGVSMPLAASLPDALKPVVRRQALQLSSEDFVSDARGIARTVGRYLADDSPPRSALTAVENLLLAKLQQVFGTDDAKELLVSIEALQEKRGRRVGNDFDETLRESTIVEWFKEHKNQYRFLVSEPEFRGITLLQPSTNSLIIGIINAESNELIEGETLRYSRLDPVVQEWHRDHDLVIYE